MIDGQLKFTIIPRRHASMTHEQFVQYHRERHAPLFASLAVVKQHVRRQQGWEKRIWSNSQRPAAMFRGVGPTEILVARAPLAHSQTNKSAHPDC
jgi:hypothetical protein